VTPKCDRHIAAPAIWAIFCRAGMLYLCGHCRNKHRALIIKEGYRVSEVAKMPMTLGDDW
jgi:hypothetical protein